MLEKIEDLRQTLQNEALDTLEKVEEFRLKYLSRKGIISQLFEQFKDIDAKEKAIIGKALNELKKEAQQRWEQQKAQLTSVFSIQAPRDLTLPGGAYRRGGRHPISIVQWKILKTFQRMGFVIVTGPEIEDDWHNFTGLNFEPDHPARDMQDTFFISEDKLLRTHATSVQVRILETHQPPIRAVAPGRVYRNEAITARSHCFFNQVDGFYVDKDVSFSDLKTTLFYLVHQLFGKNVEIRLRASYFPFTEISAELDISCLICGGKGCRVCKDTGYVEILGCGMIDPNVLENCHISAQKYSGFAFGMGVERIAMLLFQIPDLRLYTQNDIRFLQQFSAVQL
ncbi:MAG: phenylalanine--tRNA ligase subunit alpha [Bacteroidia bacterium]|nr:phenylalanine--tRNA ligase subunit alpha [Bacteroidia bacterium]MDW8159790.1 phenylalanine--tRNA ligase subunit alpha [Bacteroidia bacterium]